MQTRILFGITSKSHTEISLDEMYGLIELGYVCDQFEFGGKKNFKSAIARFYIIFLNAIKLLFKAYQFKPNFIYLNSRVEYIASVRDFVTVIIMKLFYFRKVYFLIKSHGSNLEVLQSDIFFYKAIVFPLLKRCVRGWLFLSTEELSWIISDKLLDESKIFLTKNIVRSEKFIIENDFRKRHNIPDDHTILLFVGRVVKEKGLYYVVEAFAAIKDKYKIFLVVVGDGEELNVIKRQIIKLNISKQVLFTGWINEATVASFTSNSNVLVYPTFAPEGFPMALFNSLASGLSIITTPIRAAYDYLEDTKNCLWVKPKSSESIIIALNKLLGNKTLMDEMRVNNKQKVQLFNRSSVCMELSAILHAIQANEYDNIFREVKKPFANINCI